MSAFTTDVNRANEYLSNHPEHGDTAELQAQRYTSSDIQEHSRTVTMNEADEARLKKMETDISASQKMLSAVSGSLLTSLLGKYSLSSWFNCMEIIHLSPSYTS